MATPSKADRLPGPLKEALANLWYSRRYTLDEIKSFLEAVAAGARTFLPPELAEAAEGVSVGAGDLPSRSGLGRHFKGLDQVADRLQRSRAVAEALVRKLGDSPEDRTARLNIELMHSAILDLFMSADPDADGELGAPVKLDPAAAMLLSTSLKNLASAKKSDADLVLKLRQEIAKEAAKKVDAAAKRAAAAGEKGLSADALAQLRRELAGMA